MQRIASSTGATVSYDRYGRGPALGIADLRALTRYDFGAERLRELRVPVMLEALSRFLLG